ncbi:50S ribosomal protein L4 [Patescibacteria group bacterium]|nr:50S ribosomal protein L4 [Patescibacteria group bacterium]
MATTTKKLSDKTPKTAAKVRKPSVGKSVSGKKTVKPKIKTETATVVKSDTALTALPSHEYTQVFSASPSSALLAQYVRVYQFNQRKGSAKTKTRGEVSGSGKKPWKQKGTGRARVGSIRTPVWRHGGISHGPVLKDWSLTMPRKMKTAAFSTALVQKIQHAQVYVIEKIDLSEGRTKELVQLIKAWDLFGKVLIVTEEINPHLLTASANLKQVQIAVWTNLNAYQLIDHTNIVFEEGAWAKIKEKYGKQH